MKTIIPFFILLFGVQFIILEKTIQAQETTFKTAEEVEELYLMHGIQISKRFCYIGHPDVCEEGEVMDSDTLSTAFLVRVTFNSENPDSVLFDGLEGVNTGPREMIPDGFNGGAAAYPECTSPSSDCGHARKTGTDLEFLVSSPGGYYWGTGTLDNDMLTIQTKYVYRGSGADYILEGHKIVEEK